MKKIIIVLLALSFLSVSGLSSAALLKKEVVKGPITSIDLTKNEIVVADFRSGRTFTFVVPASIINSLQKGSVYIVLAKPGSNKADSVRLVVARPARARPAAAPAVAPAVATTAPAIRR